MTRFGNLVLNATYFLILSSVTSIFLIQSRIIKSMNILYLKVGSTKKKTPKHTFSLFNQFTVLYREINRLSAPVVCENKFKKLYQMETAVNYMYSIYELYAI